MTPLDIAIAALEEIQRKPIEAENFARYALIKIRDAIIEQLPPPEYTWSADGKIVTFKNPISPRDYQTLLPNGFAHFSTVQPIFEALERDAARYRLIKALSRSDLYAAGIDLNWYEPTENLDEVCDAAIAAKEQQL